jgi:hypothetical protein
MAPVSNDSWCCGFTGPHERMWAAAGNFYFLMEIVMPSVLHTIFVPDNFTLSGFIVQSLA